MIKLFGNKNRNLYINRPTHNVRLWNPCEFFLQSEDIIFQEKSSAKQEDGQEMPKLWHDQHFTRW